MDTHHAARLIKSNAAIKNDHLQDITAYCESSNKTIGVIENAARISRADYDTQMEIKTRNFPRDKKRPFLKLLYKLGIIQDNKQK